MPRAKSSTSAKAKPEPIVEFFELGGKPNPRYTSFVSRNAAIIEQRTTNSSLQTESEKTRDLKAGENQDLIKILGPDYSDQFKSPYDTVELIRYHEAWRDDGIASSSLDFLIQFMLGDHFKTVIDVNTEFDSEDEQKVALKRFSDNPRIKFYKKKVDQINREIKFYTSLYSLLVQMCVFGRCCGLIERSDVDNLPIALKVLPSMHLGQVYAHRKTWNVLGVEHKDWKFPASILKAEDIVYIPMRNHNVSPGTLHYGYSLFERVVDLSELNRITNQRNLKEINYRLWAAFLLIRVPNSYNKDTMRKLKDQLAKGAGNSIVTNQTAQIEVMQIGHDLEKLLDERDKNYREIIRQLQIPIILFDPDILNRATSQELMEAWNTSVLANYRSWLKDMIQDQWINPIIKTLIESERKGLLQTEPTEPESEPQFDEPEEPGNAPGNEEDREEPIDEEEMKAMECERLSKTPLTDKEIIPIEAIDPATNEVLVYRLPWKVKIEFEPHNYDTFKEKAETAILLKNNGLCTTERALTIIGLDDEVEKQKLLELEQERKAERFGKAFAQSQNPDATDDEKAKAMMESMKQEAKQTAGEGNGPNRARSLQRQKDKMRNDINQSLNKPNIKGNLRR